MQTMTTPARPRARRGAALLLLAACANAQPGVAATLDRIRALEEQVSAMVEFNQPPPVFEDPFRLPLHELGLAYPSQAKEGTCYIEYLEPANSVYQLVTLSDEKAAKVQDDAHFVFNHDGPCGLCSSPRDYVHFALVHHDVLPAEQKPARAVCTAKGLLSRGWGTECFRVSNLSTQCAELMQLEAMAALRTCGLQCMSFSLEQASKCWEACRAIETLPTFARMAGRHFGMPNDAVALKLPRVDTERVKHANAWRQPKYPDAFVEAIREKRLMAPQPRPQSSPYFDLSANHTIDFHAVCALKFTPPAMQGYTMDTYPSAAAARAAGAVVTHQGNCGACSTLQDLAVYVSRPDLTTPVRRCAFRSFLSNDWSRSCLMDLGFSEPCANVWLYNAENTRLRCVYICLLLMRSKNNLDDGRLNSCLQCDEDMSGPFFKKYSARTRRNSGLHSAIVRPGPAIVPLEHHYPGVPEPLRGEAQAAADPVVAEREDL